jgi:hypothetical protein
MIVRLNLRPMNESTTSLRRHKAVELQGIVAPTIRRLPFSTTNRIYLRDSGGRGSRTCAAVAGEAEFRIPRGSDIVVCMLR